MKLVIVMRTDLDMGRGKMAAQAAHAAVTAALADMPADALQDWFALGQPKVVLRANEEELLLAVALARRAGLAVHVVRDAGRTQVQPGTVTCAAIGPGASDALDAVTGALRLL